MKCHNCTHFNLQRHPFFDPKRHDPKDWPIMENCKVWNGNGVEYAWTVCKGSMFEKIIKEIQLSLWK